MTDSPSGARHPAYRRTAHSHRLLARGTRWGAWALRLAHHRTPVDGRRARAPMMMLTGRPAFHAVFSRSVRLTSHVTHLHLAVNARFAAHTHNQHGGRDVQGLRRWRHLVISPGAHGSPAAPNGGGARTRAGTPNRVGAGSTRHLLAVLARPRSAMRVAAAGRRRIAAPSTIQAVIGHAETRVARRYQRIEEMVSGRQVTRDRADVAAEVARVLAAAETVAATAPSSPAVNSPVPMPGHHIRSAAIDLEGLTDQIVTRLDDRLTAHRERFGRAL